ncbi:uncharacterized protein FIBRA_08890 [Fibroporia radiculosa]|uniref:Uncharacterized protein n=1 Tax=Fibroporia radiculosa TaxID=599839 RepID=J4ICL3_9APHY|nr:uncharacterized protein FIBRA_08890 [Fibroporia radiculosa]CCM06611.1 predicted protein [Fibroporia radiculosa]
MGNPPGDDTTDHGDHLYPDHRSTLQPAISRPTDLCNSNNVPPAPLASQPHSFSGSYDAVSLSATMAPGPVVRDVSLCERDLLGIPANMMHGFRSAFVQYEGGSLSGRPDYLCNFKYTGPEASFSSVESLSSWAMERESIQSASISQAGEEPGGKVGCYDQEDSGGGSEGRGRSIRDNGDSAVPFPADGITSTASGTYHIPTAPASDTSMSIVAADADEANIIAVGPAGTREDMVQKPIKSRRSRSWSGRAKSKTPSTTGQNVLPSSLSIQTTAVASATDDSVSRRSSVRLRLKGTAHLENNALHIVGVRDTTEKDDKQRRKGNRSNSGISKSHTSRRTNRGDMLVGSGGSSKPLIPSPSVQSSVVVEQSEYPTSIVNHNESCVEASSIADNSETTWAPPSTDLDVMERAAGQVCIQRPPASTCHPPEAPVGPLHNVQIVVETVSRNDAKQMHTPRPELNLTPWQTHTPTPWLNWQTQMCYPGISPGISSPKLNTPFAGSFPPSSSTIPTLQDTHTDSVGQVEVSMAPVDTNIPLPLWPCIPLPPSTLPNVFSDTSRFEPVPWLPSVPAYTFHPVPTGASEGCLPLCTPSSTFHSDPFRLFLPDSPEQGRYSVSGIPAGSDYSSNRGCEDDVEIVMNQSETSVNVRGSQTDNISLENSVGTTHGM